MLHYIRQDMKQMFKSDKFLLILLVVIQIVSTVVIFLSYGIINHFNTKIGEVEGTALYYEFDMAGEETVSTRSLRAFYDEVLPVIENKLDYFFIMGFYEGTGIMSSTGYKDGKYTISSHMERVFGQYFSLNAPERLFTEEELQNGEYVCIAGIDAPYENRIITIGDNEYRVVGIDGDFLNTTVMIPYTVFPDNDRMFHTSIFLTKPLLEDEYNIIAAAAVKNFGDALNIPEFNGIQNESEYRVYRSIIVVLIIFVVICSINYCIIYKYLLEKRRRMFAVSRICGCTRGRAVMIYMTELVFTSLLFMTAGVILFVRVVLPNMKDVFEYMQYYFDNMVYIRIMALYIGAVFITYLVLVCGFVSKTPVELMREVP